MKSAFLLFRINNLKRKVFRKKIDIVQSLDFLWKTKNNIIKEKTVEKRSSSFWKLLKGKPIIWPGRDTLSILDPSRRRSFILVWKYERWVYIKQDRFSLMSGPTSVTDALLKNGPGSSESSPFVGVGMMGDLDGEWD